MPWFYPYRAACHLIKHTSRLGPIRPPQLVSATPLGHRHVPNSQRWKKSITKQTIYINIFQYPPVFTPAQCAMCNTYQEPYKGIMKHPQLAPVFCEKMSSTRSHPPRRTLGLKAFALVYGQLPVREQLLNLFEGHRLCGQKLFPHGNAMILRVKNACQYGYCFGPTFFANKCAQNCDSSHSATGAAYEATFPRQGKCNLTLEMSCRTGRGRKNIQYHKTMAHDNT